MTDMKSLSLAKPLAIMLVGIPGAGKSFFASQFSETFNAPVVRYDRIRAELFAEPSYAPDEEEIVARVAGYMIRELLKTKKSFIIDGGCNVKTSRMQYERLIRDQGYGSLVVWVQTDLTTAQRRSTKRNPKKVDDMLNPSMSDDQFDKLSKRLTAPSVHEASVVISGKHTYPTQAKVVLRKLVVPREEQHTAPNPTPPPRPQDDGRLRRHNVTIR